MTLVYATLVYATPVRATPPCAKHLGFLCVILFGSLQNMPSIPKGERWRCPECSKDHAFPQRRRHIKTRHSDTDLVSVLAQTDAPLVESGHTFKRENRSRRFRRKLSSGPQQNTKEPSINKINGSNSSRSEGALAFKTVDRHPPSTTTVIAPQPESAMWILANPVEDRVDGQRALWVAVPAASEEDSCFPWLSKDSLSGFSRRCLHLF